MLELEANKASVETNIAALLEDEEVMDTNSARMSSSLPMILKVGVTYTWKFMGHCDMILTKTISYVNLENVAFVIVILQSPIYN